MKNTAVFNSRNFFLLGLFSIVVGLSLSKPLISLGQMILLLTWIFDGNIKEKLINYINNKTAVFISLIYFLTVFGLLYTSNFEYASGDIRRKAALFGLPFLIAGFPPVTNKEWKLIFKVYVGGVLTSSLWSLFVFLGGLGGTIVDVREYSRFTSHIRFGLEICFAIFGSVYFVQQEKTNTNKLLWLLVVVWFIGFLYLMSLFTGLVIFGITTIILFLFIGISFSKPWVKYTIYVSLFSLFGFVVFTFMQTYQDHSQQKDRVPLESLLLTPSGSKYFQNEEIERGKEKENGYYVWNNIAWNEIKTEWNKKSSLDFDGLDKKNQDLSTTLIRYLTSKGLYKDASSIQQLTNKDIEAIEKGISNYKDISSNNFQKRVNKIIWEFSNYQDGRDFNGHSVIMRWEYWKTAFRIFKQNLWLGVGTGDVQDAFNAQYEKDQSSLLLEFRRRSHNQYITYALTFGFLGIVWFILFLFYPILKQKMYRDFVYLAFFSIVTISMLTEDTLESQVGINFFVLFNTILLLKEKTQNK